MIGISVVGLGIVASYGLCQWVRLPYGPVHPILPFLLLGIGVDNMFIIIQVSWQTFSILKISNFIPNLRTRKCVFKVWNGQNTRFILISHVTYQIKLLVLFLVCFGKASKLTSSQLIRQYYLSEPLEHSKLYFAHLFKMDIYLYFRVWIIYQRRIRRRI